MVSARLCGLSLIVPINWPPCAPIRPRRAAFEVAIRLETPVQTFFRTTTRDVEIGGASIGEGEKVQMLLAAANRDPCKWPDPD
jgi:cytochrome P450